MRKLVLFMHCSLDSFVAGPKGEMGWIIVNEDLFDYAGDQTDRSDLAMYGRVTFDMMEAYWPTAADKPDASRHDKHHSAWYKQVQKVVLSKTLKESSYKNTRVLSENIAEEVLKLKQKPGKEIVIFGSPSVGHLLTSANLIDEYWLFVNPILLGTGIPLFKGIKQKIKLKLISSKAFDSGVVCLQYQRDFEK